jgi:hypothetical protein
MAQGFNPGSCLMGSALKGHQMRDSLYSTRQTSHTQDSDAREASFSSSSSNPGERSDGVLEYWSIAHCRNCTPRPRGWECFQGVSCGVKPKVKTLGYDLEPLRGKEPHDCELKSCYRLSPPASRLGFQLCGNGMDRSTFPATCEIVVDDATIGGFVQAGRKYRQFGFDFAFVSSGDGSIQSLLLRFDSGEH